MSRLGFIYSVNECIGCKACQIACKDKNNLEVGSFFRKVDTINYKGKYIHYSGACNHCEDPACTKNCPTGAMHIAKDKTVQHISGKCIGCGMCVWSCPYGAVKLSNQNGIASKCDLCIDLRQDGQKPICVQACITHCLDFGYIQDSDEKNHPNYLPSNKITNPSLVIKVKNKESK